MPLKLVVNSADPPIGALLAAELVQPKLNSELKLEWSNDFGKNTAKLQFFGNDGKLLGDTNSSVARYLARAKNDKLYGGSDDAFIRTEVDHWLSFAERPLAKGDELKDVLVYLNLVLAPRTWLVAKDITIADICLFSTVYTEINIDEIKERYPNLSRWYKQITALPETQKVLEQVLKNRTKDAKVASAGKKGGSTPKEGGKNKEQAKFVDLPGAEMGKVVVRFPPEASGYLHIGHAKAALLNQYYAEYFKGQLIMRFDDTNPAKENVEFEQAILEDLKMLQVKYDRFTHSSDYFDLMLDYCEKLIKDGKAFVDDTPAEQMKEQRDQKLPSANRDNSVEKNLELWKQMVNGTERGQKCCVRAKIDYQSPNGCLRDPTIYRCKPEPHPKTGTKYKVYPTYDFACPIVDAIEGVTHTLRTTEYHDRDDQFYWFVDALKLNRPHIYEYSRLNMTNTVLSKRKLTWFVAEGLVDGWDDPRFPTVRGILRRGMTVEGLKQFIIAQGSSRSVVFMEWDKIWAFNKKVIDPIAIRYTALTAGDTVPVNVKGVTESFITVANHPKDPAIGTKQVRIAPKVLIEEEDAEALQEGQNATFINWGNLMIEKIKKENGKVVEVDASLNLDNKDFKKTAKLTWIAADTPDTAKKPNTTSIPCYTVYFDHIITKPVLAKDDEFKNFVAKDTRREIEMVGEAELRRVKKGEIIQLQRKGFFRCDVPYAEATAYSFREQPLILFHIPDGHSTITLPGAADKTAVKEKKETNAEGSAAKLNEAIIAQGNKVRDLKAAKADKNSVTAEVKVLLDLKTQYKAATGEDWTPNAAPAAKSAPVQHKDEVSAAKLNEAIIAQGNKVRDLKAAKADKAHVDCEIKDLLSLKTKYKSVTGQEWKPGVTPPAQNNTQKESAKSDSVIKISESIVTQGNKVRELKSAKAEKPLIDTAVKILLALKTLYKVIAGKDWGPDATPPVEYNAPKEPEDSEIAIKIREEIITQGNKVRELKSAKADKAEIDTAVNILLVFKDIYKDVTGKEWKPNGPSTVSNASTELKSCSSDKILEEIAAQGNKVRELKNAKADKSTIDAEVKILLGLKEKYKTITGESWTPGATPAPKSAPKESNSTSPDQVNEEIIAQGNKVRELKSSKADKSKIDEAVKVLLSLKDKYKTLTGQNWTPDKNTAPAAKSDKPVRHDSLALEIKKQNDLVNNLRFKKPDAVTVSKEVAKLINLKNEYKKLTGKIWSSLYVSVDKVPSSAASTTKMVQQEQTNAAANGDSNLEQRVTDQGNKIRELKASKADAGVIKQEVEILKALKEEYKKAFGKEYVAPGAAPREAKAKAPKPEAAKPAAKAAKKPENVKESTAKESDSSKTGTRLGLEAKKNENLPDWYSQVITKGEMIEYYDVSGCYILRPWSYSIWDIIKDFFDKEIKKLGVRNCYFPIFVSKAALEREKTHIADFAPEVAWVTKSGESDLAEHIAIRPTSETVMYPAYAKWLKSHRDLPLKLNQWNNVVRWEFKHPQPFLRTREFLWQEGHTAFATKPEADEEVLAILDLYAQIYEDFLAIPVVKGRKTEKEKFAGGDYTTTVEAYIEASGRAIQGATSHHLGQNFSKMFDIQIEGAVEGGEKTFVYQNSWGITTRTIGVMIMVHGDDKGLVLPPRVACIQAIIVPCGITASTTPEQKEKLLNECKELEKAFNKRGELRIEGDYRDNYSPGWKFNHWELKGVPVRVELGPKDLEKGQVTFVRRDTAERTTAKRAEAYSSLVKLLNTIQANLFEKARIQLKQHTKQTHNWNEFCKYLDEKNLILAPFCGKVECEDKIKADSVREAAADEPGAPSMGAKSLCIPFNQPDGSIEGLKKLKCIHHTCQEKPQFYTLFGRSY